MKFISYHTNIKFILFHCVSLFVVNLYGQSPSWSIAKSFGGSNSDFVKNVKLDNQGNSILVGNYFSTDFLIDTSRLHSLGWHDIFVVKLDPLGNLFWAKSIGGTDSDINSSTCIDSRGNIYITGYFFSDSITIDNTVIYNPAPHTSGPLFLLKLDPSGNVLLAETSLNSQFSFGDDLAIDTEDNLFITGSSSDTVIYFNRDTLLFPHPNINTQSFIYKIDSLGNTIWSKSLSGNSYATNCLVKTDRSGNSVYALYSDSIVYLDSTIISQSSYSSNIHLIKLDANGNFIWTNQFHGLNQLSCRSVAINENGDIYIIGNSSSDTLIFDSLHLFNPTHSDNIFIAKYDSAGNFNWAKYFGGSDLDEGFDIAVNSDDGPTIIGYYTSPILMIDSLQLQNPVAGKSNIYLIRFDKDGNVIFAENYGGPEYDEGMALTIDTADFLYICGQFSSNNILFNNLNVLNSSQSYNIYFLRSELPLSAESMTTKDASNLVNIYPNPSAGHFQIDSSDPVEKIIVSDLLGRIVYERNYSGTITKNISVDLSEKGVYFVQAQMKRNTCATRVIVSR